MALPDPHSHFDTEQPRVKRLHLKWTVDFEAKRLSGSVALDLAAPGSGALDLDTKGLDITSVRTASGEACRFELGDDDAILGRRLRLNLPGGTTAVAIDYATSPDAVALQWLTPAMTEGKKH